MAGSRTDFQITPSDWGHLSGRVESLEDSMRILFASNENITTQIAELAVQQHRSNEHKRRMEDALKANTDLTREVLESTKDTRDMVQIMRDAQAAGRLGKRMSKAAGKALVWASGIVAAVAAAWWSIFHGPKG